MAPVQQIGLVQRAPGDVAAGRQRAQGVAVVALAPRDHPVPRRLAALDMVLAGELDRRLGGFQRSDEHTSELQSLMSTSYAVLFLHKKQNNNNHYNAQMH